MSATCPERIAAHAGSVDVVHAQRSTGSVLKPFLYADMLQTGELLPDMLQADVPTRYDGFRPRNFDEQHTGAVPASVGARPLAERSGRARTAPAWCGAYAQDPARHGARFISIVARHTMASH